MLYVNSFIDRLMKRLKNTISFIIIFLLSYQITFGKDCCQDTKCSNRAQDLSERLQKEVVSLGPKPGNAQARSVFLDSLKHANPNKYQSIMNIAAEYNKRSKNDSDKKRCFFSFILNGDVNDWVTTIVARNAKPTPLRSPEFCKGSGIHIDANYGVFDLGKNTEAFSSSLRALWSYTFSKNGNCGGRFRIMLGPAAYYQDNAWEVLGNLRGELRLGDLGVKYNHTWQL